MPRLQALLECVGQSLCEKGRKALQGQWDFADVMLDVAKTAFDYTHRKLPGPDVRVALADCAAVDPREYERRVGELIAELATTHSVPKAELANYLRALPQPSARRSGAVRPERHNDSGKTDALQVRRAGGVPAPAHPPLPPRR